MIDYLRLTKGVIMPKNQIATKNEVFMCVEKQNLMLRMNNWSI